QALSHHVVDLVRAGMGEVLALEQDPDAQAVRQAPAFGARRGAAGIVAQEPGVLASEPRVAPSRTERRLELLARRDQRLGNETTPELTEAARRAGLAHGRPEGRRHRH